MFIYMVFFLLVLGNNLKTNRINNNVKRHVDITFDVVSSLLIDNNFMFFIFFFHIFAFIPYCHSFIYLLLKFVCSEIQINGTEKKERQPRRRIRRRRRNTFEVSG